MMEINIKEKIVNSTAIETSVLLICFLSAVFIVNPFGNFPLNDDWSFARTVKRLLELQMYVPTGWTAMSLLTNVLWGSLFCIPAGFSFDALRLSTLVASFGGCVGVYFGAKELCVGRLGRMVAVLLLMFNPIYFALSHTFMTDVLFTVLAAVSALFFLRYLKYETVINLIFAIFFAIAAMLSRQLGIAIPLAFAVSYMLIHGFSLKSCARAILPLLVCIVVLVCYQHWLFESGRMTALYSEQNGKLLAMLQRPKILMQSVLINSYIALLYMGLFLLPLLLAVFPEALRGSRFSARYMVVSVILVGVFTYIFNHYFGWPKLPLLGNILAKFGIGPLTLRDTYVLGAAVPVLPSKFWKVVTCLALFGSMLLLFVFIGFLIRLVVEIRHRKVSQNTSFALFLGLSVLVYLMATFTSQVFDRYLLPVIPLLTLAVLSTLPAGKMLGRIQFKAASIVLLLGLVVFSICTTRDYLSWNRARWQALTDLEKTQNVEREDIDGGFEFNGFYLYERSYRPQRDKSWWWVEGDTYIISFNPIPGYTVLKEYSYSHWLPRYEGKIFVSQRAEF